MATFGGGTSSGGSRTYRPSGGGGGHWGGSVSTGGSSVYHPTYSGGSGGFRGSTGGSRTYSSGGGGGGGGGAAAAAAAAHAAAVAAQQARASAALGVLGYHTAQGSDPKTAVIQSLLHSGNSLSSLAGILGTKGTNPLKGVKDAAKAAQVDAAQKQVSKLLQQNQNSGLKASGNVAAPPKPTALGSFWSAPSTKGMLAVANVAKPTGLSTSGSLVPTANKSYLPVIHFEDHSTGLGSLSTSAPGLKATGNLIPAAPKPAAPRPGGFSLTTASIPNIASSILGGSSSKPAPALTSSALQAAKSTRTSALKGLLTAASNQQNTNAKSAANAGLAAAAVQATAHLAQQKAQSDTLTGGKTDLLTLGQKPSQPKSQAAALTSFTSQQTKLGAQNAANAVATLLHAASTTGAGPSATPWTQRSPVNSKVVQAGLVYLRQYGGFLTQPAPKAQAHFQSFINKASQIKGQYNTPFALAHAAAAQLHAQPSQSPVGYTIKQLAGLPGGTAGSGPVGGSGSTTQGLNDSRLTAGQKAFGLQLAKKTGLNGGVIAAWMLKEESSGAAQTREAAGNHNWLNIGYTGGSAANPFHADPKKAADITAKWMQGKTQANFGTASPGIRNILPQARGKSPADQIAAIAGSGWATDPTYHAGLIALFKGTPGTTSVTVGTGASSSSSGTGSAPGSAGSSTSSGTSGGSGASRGSSGSATAQATTDAANAQSTALQVASSLLNSTSRNRLAQLDRSPTLKQLLGKAKGKGKPLLKAA